MEEYKETPVVVEKKPSKFKRFLAWIWKYLRPFTNWRFLISFGLAWMITNGIWYIFAFAPIKWFPEWLVWFGRAYIAFIYLPMTPEKLITIPIAVFFQTLLFKGHKKTKDQLDIMYAQAKSDWAKVKAKFKRKKKITKEEEPNANPEN